MEDHLTYEERLKQQQAAAKAAILAQCDRLATAGISLVDILTVGVDRMQRSFEPMKKQVEAWKGTRLPDEAAKLVIYRAFFEGELDVPKHLARRVHDLYFNPQVQEFAPRTTWSLSNAFTSAFKELDPIPQFRATAKLASSIQLSAAVAS